jgi:hypothetical protein
VPNYAVSFCNNIVSRTINLRLGNLKRTVTAVPRYFQKLANQQMLDQALAVCGEVCVQAHLFGAQPVSNTDLSFAILISAKAACKARADPLA